MKILAVLALFLACSAAQADTWVVTASSAPCTPFLSPATCGGAENINAIFTTQDETGVFFLDAVDQSTFGTEPVVVGISGTFNGMPMSFVQPPANPDGIEGWLFMGLPQLIYFSAGGTQYVLDWEQELPFVLGESTPPEFLSWSAVDDPVATPEAPMLAMLLTALLLLGLSRWAQMSLRKLSGRI